MKSKKHVLSLLFPLCFSCLFSCGGSSNKIVLSIGFWPESAETKDVAMYQSWRESFEKDFPQYTIKGSPYTYSPDTVAAKAQGNQLPDVFQTWFTEPETLKNSGFIRPITSFLKEKGWDEKMDDEMKDSLTFDGEIYGIPRDGYGLGLLINKKILGDNGLLPEINGSYSIYNEDGTPAYPTTWEQVKEYSETIVSQDSAKGFIMYTTNKNGGWVFSNIAWNYGAELETVENGTIKANLNCQGAVNALDWIKSMANADALTSGAGIVYNDWYSNIGERVAMAVVGSDVLQNAKLQGGVNMDELAFVPMPTGDGVNHYSLYGGTPFVFSKNCSDEKVKGILEFFNYIGRSPETSDINFGAKKVGYETAKSKGQPILPSILPWKNEDYVSKAKELENQYINVKIEDYNPFFDNIQTNKKSEEPYAAQDMYNALDSVIQSVLLSPETANSSALLTTANASFQKILDDSYNKK
ncbi:MAG: hypothetical protein LKF75_03735 [Bacilli bacterium]|jgi:ABC-type glycerol-3-phosphate transport system substrate-binding protein|nr:hypothetical protein [Bacilli bacterium]MCH4278237.1 hypothetical protein [Bacilli bacterium]